MLAWVALAACGCAVTATTGEYALYRQTRVLPGVEERLAAADDYLRKYPRGALADDVRARFKRDEALYYKSKKDSVAGLASYLRALPSGPHGVEAAGRIGALRTKQGRGEELRVAGLATAARIERAVAAREHLRDEIVGWVGRFEDPVVFTAPVSEAPRELLVPWSLSLPAPKCTQPLGKNASPTVAWRCERVEELPYVIVANGVEEAREATLSVVMDQDASGRPLSATVGGPELFLRLEEAGVVRAFDRDDSEHRVGAVSRAVELLRGDFQKRVSVDSACERAVVAPVVLDLACKGVHVTVRAGIEPGEDDVVTIRAFP
jgi:hypothetical protein